MTSLELMVKLWDMANEEVADVEKYAVCANSLKDISKEDLIELCNCMKSTQESNLEKAMKCLNKGTK